MPWRGIQEWSITVHDGICRCELCVTGIALTEAALGDMAGILREIRGELKPAEPSDELTVPGPSGGGPRPPAVFINSGAGVGHIRPGRDPWAGERSRRSNPGHRMHYQIQGLDDRGLRLMGPHHLGLQAQIPTPKSSLIGQKQCETGAP